MPNMAQTTRLASYTHSMNSSTSRYAERQQTQDDIKKQIALLQACLEPEPAPQTTPLVPKSPKRKTIEAVTLAPATPSPKKKRKLNHNSTLQPPPRPVFHTASQQNASHSGGNIKVATDLIFKPPPSQLLSKLARMSSINADPSTTEPLPRSTGFTEKPKEIEPAQEERFTASKRDDRLALINDLEPGPYEHSPPFDDPKFDKLEPNSGIYLTSRSIPHEDFADYLRGRFYLSPSRLYSAIRLLPDKQGYDVPVPGDWITIAVVAERGPIKFTRAPVTIEAEDRDNKDKKKKGRYGVNEPPEKSSGKKYVNLKLIDFGARSSSTTGGTSVIRGDAFLTLLLFESDGFDLISRGDGMKPEKLYKGGSRGAFEHLTKVKEGDVIALLNPKILKPFQRSSDKPHPVDNVLALTPESASSIMVIGRSRDLGMCTVRKQDGKVCGSWCDKRVSEICDYHVQNAVQRRRAARPEFSIGTSGMSTSSSSTYKRKTAYDPQRQWGLKPEDGSIGDGATYVVSGHVVSGTSADPRTTYLTETIGRDGQAKAKRKMGGGQDAADRALKALLERDKEGMKAVMSARETGKVLAKSEEERRKGKNKCEQGKGDRRDKRKQVADDACGEASGAEKRQQSSYSAGIIRSLGFDPSIKMGSRRTDNTNSQNKLDLLEAVRTSRKDIVLGPRPGPKIRSGVMTPKRDETLTKPSGNEQLKDLELPDNAEDSDEMPDKLATKSQVADEKMVDLDDF